MLQAVQANPSPDVFLEYAQSLRGVSGGSWQMCVARLRRVSVVCRDSEVTGVPSVVQVQGSAARRKGPDSGSQLARERLWRLRVVFSGQRYGKTGTWEERCSTR